MIQSWKKTKKNLKKIGNKKIIACNFTETNMNISSDQKLQLEKRARQTKDKHEHTRLCVILARSEGMSHESIAQAHRISVSSVYQYVADYEN